MSGGQYRQYVRAPRASSSIGVIPDSASTSLLTVAEATHLVLGLAQDFGDGIRLGLDGYFKQFEGLDPKPDARTHASGVDLWLRRNTGSFTGWLGYSLSWVWTVEGSNRDSDSFRDALRSADFDFADLAGPATFGYSPFMVKSGRASHFVDGTLEVVGDWQSED